MREHVRSFSDPETHFTLLSGDEGDGQPTGEVMCDECGRVAGAPEYIPHEPGCPQSDVKSEWWAMTHAQAIQDSPTPAEEVSLGVQADGNVEAGAD